MTQRELAGSALRDQDGQPLGPARLGAELRAVRERLGWSLAEVANGLRIRLPYLEAIERGELSALPGPAYQAGFLRTYAQALGLDPEEILRRFRAEGMSVAPKAELSFLAPVPDRAVPTGAIVLVGVVLLLVGYGLWFRHTEHERRLIAAVPAVPAQLAPLAVPKPALPPADTGSRLRLRPKRWPPRRPRRCPNPPRPPPHPPPRQPRPPCRRRRPPPRPRPLALPAGQAILATADSWVEVRDSSGNILFSRVLHAGESWPVPDEAGLTMTAGNAGATEIAENGKPGAPLGAAGTVARHYPLTPAATPAPTSPAKTD